MLVDFKLLSDSSKLWVFQSDKIISPSNQKILINEISPFLTDWSSHGAEIKSSFEIRYGLFLIISVDEEINSASGCSIDKLTNFIIRISNETGVDFFNRLNSLSGQALHAKTLGFVHPKKKKWMSFNSELPDGFKKILNLLENLSS